MMPKIHAMNLPTFKKKTSQEEGTENIKKASPSSKLSRPHNQI